MPTPAELVHRSPGGVHHGYRRLRRGKASSSGPDGLAVQGWRRARWWSIARPSPRTRRAGWLPTWLAGVAFLDALVSGGAQGARDATLAIMAGMPRFWSGCGPLLECLGKRIVHVGPSGAGQGGQGR